MREVQRDSRFDILFEPVQIGPVVARNRFYQVPHCTGMGWRHPRMLAEMRGIKAEGGWGVVCTEWCSIHPSSDDLPYPNASLWNESDIAAHSLMTEKVHDHGALAGVELWHGGARAQNWFTREVPMDVASVPNAAGFPFQTRSMNKSDIRDLRSWHRKAALRAKAAEFDIVYVYATHGYLLSHFLSASTNTRTDEYGGSLENRVRIVRELLEETQEAVGDRCAVAIRFSADSGGGNDGQPIIGEHREMIEILADLPDLWDINIADYSLEMGTSRFVRQGALEPYVGYVKSVTDKPVVSVGRFTSPDTMAQQVRDGVVDFIGAARPSIADPFLPKKIEQGRTEDIRECIGCNICYSGDGIGVPILCTQNPTISEGWRRGWHPEIVSSGPADSRVLVVGGGPAGLEATRVLGQRGYRVMLAEATRELGGRVSRECQLPGLSEWSRVRDYRVQQINALPNVEVYLESMMTAQDVLEVGADHVVVATGAVWRRDGVGRFHVSPPRQYGAQSSVFTFDDLAQGRSPEGNIVVFDDDFYYHASTMAEQLAVNGHTVTLVTTANSVSSFSGYTGEQTRVYRRLLECGVEILTAHGVSLFDGNEIAVQCVHSGREKRMQADHLVSVTSRQPVNDLFLELAVLHSVDDRPGLKSIKAIGDCDAPGLIAHAVFAGHRFARELDAGQTPRYDRVFQQD